MKRFIAGVIPFLFSVLLAGADVGSVSNLYTEAVGSVQICNITWNNHAALSNVLYVTGATKWLCGEVRRVTLLPSMSTNTTYTVTLKDDTGTDILAGRGSAVATNATTSFCPTLQSNAGTAYTNGVPIVFNSALTLMVTSAFSTNSVTNYTGSLSIYYAPPR